MSDSETLWRASTFDGGRYHLRTLLRGEDWKGLWLDDQAPRRPAWITYRRIRNSSRLAGIVRYDVHGMTTLRYLGPPDGDDPHMREEWTAVIEDAPTGTALSEASVLSESETAKLGISLCELVVNWAAVRGGTILQGLRPETVFLVGEAGTRRFSVATPRPALLLSTDHRYGHLYVETFSGPGFDGLEGSPSEGGFTVALLLWVALTGLHPYVERGRSVDENMSEDRRQPFPFESKLGRLLERVLVADAEKRPSIDEFREELTRLA